MGLYPQQDKAQELDADLATLAATGNSQGTAAAITHDMVYVTASDGTKAVSLPTAKKGRKIIIKNTVAAQALPVYPATGAQVNAAGANAAVNIEGGGVMQFIAASATQWYAEIRVLSDAELTFLDGVAAGTLTASKALVVGATANLDKHPLIDPASLASAGAPGVQGDAPIVADTTLVTGANGTKAVTLPVAVAGHQLVVINNEAAQHLHVFPAAGAAINALGANAAMQIEGGCFAIFFAQTATQWYGFSLPTTFALTSAEAALLSGAGTGGTPVASKAQVADANRNIGAVKATSLSVGASGAEVAIASSPAQIDAAVAGLTLIYRTNVTTAQINAGATAVVPAVADKRFHVLAILMKSNGNVGTATTVGVKEDGGAVFLSHVQADLTNGVWHDLVTGTPVVTGMTSGGTTAVANKALVAYCAGGVLDTATSVDFIVAGFYTT